MQLQVLMRPFYVKISYKKLVVGSKERGLNIDIGYSNTVGKASLYLC